MDVGLLFWFGPEPAEGGAKHDHRAVRRFDKMCSLCPAEIIHHHRAQCFETAHQFILPV
jgi:hypothetical protein